MLKTMGQALDEAIRMHETKYPGSAVYNATVKPLGESTTKWLVEVEAEHFSVWLRYVVSKEEDNSMSNCGACGKACRTTSLAHVADPEGGLSRKRVCGACFDGALHIVAHVTQVTKGVAEKDVQRRDAREAVAGAVKKLRGMAKSYEAAASSAPDEQGRHAEGRAAGLDQAADVLEAGDY